MKNNNIEIVSKWTVECLNYPENSPGANSPGGNSPGGNSPGGNSPGGGFTGGNLPPRIHRGAILRIPSNLRQLFVDIIFIVDIGNHNPLKNWIVFTKKIIHLIHLRLKFVKSEKT